MINVWPFLILLPPLVVTIFRGRSAWLWLSLAISTAALFGAVQHVLSQYAQGNTDPLLGFLVISGRVDTNYHDTYYIVANFTALLPMLMPSLIIGALLFLRAHPRRAKTDIFLFWAVIAASLGATYAFTIIFNGGGMPRRYIDGLNLERLLLVTRVLRYTAMILIIIAALRPILSWWRTRGGPPHAL